MDGPPKKVQRKAVRFFPEDKDLVSVPARHSSFTHEYKARCTAEDTRYNRSISEDPNLSQIMAENQEKWEEWKLSKLNGNNEEKECKEGEEIKGERLKKEGKWRENIGRIEGI